VNGLNWLQKLMVFSLVSTVAVDNGWASLLDFGAPRSSAFIGCPKFCELTGGRSACLCHWGKFFGEGVVENQGGGCRVPLGRNPFGPFDADEPQGPPENRYQIGHHPGTGVTGRSTNGHSTNLGVGAGVLSGEIVWVAAIPTCDWLSSRVQLIWCSPPIWELLKVPIA